MANNKVNFFIEFKQKGLEFVKKYKDEIKQLGTNAKLTSRSNQDLNNSLDKTNTSTSKTTKNVKELNKELKETQKTSSNLGKNIGLAIGVAATAFTAYNKKVLDTIDNQSKLAQVAGVSFEEFQGFAKTAELSGVSVETLSKSFFELNKVIQEANLGEGEGLKILNALSIDAGNLAKLRPEEQLRLIANEVKGLPDLEKKLVFDKLKIKDIELLINNLDQVDQINKKLKEDGLLLSTEDAAKFEEFNDQITALFQTLEAFTATFLSELLPELISLLDQAGTGDSFFNGENAKELAESFIKVISLLKLFVSVSGVAKESLQSIAEPLVYIFFLLGEESKSALEKFKNNFETYAKLIDNGAFDQLFKSLSVKLLGFLEDFNDSLAKVSAISGIVFNQAGFDSLSKKLILKSVELKKSSDEYALSREEILKTSAQEIKDLEEKNKLEDDLLDKKKKALKTQFDNRSNTANIDLNESLKTFDNDIDLVNKAFNKTLTKPDKSVIEKNTKETSKIVSKSLLDNYEMQSSGSYQKLLNEINKGFEIADLKFKLNPESKDQYIEEIKTLSVELEEIVKIFGTQDELLKTQLQTQIRIKELTDDTVIKENLRKEILSAQISLLKENGKIAESIEIERNERLNDIEKEFKNLEQKAELIDLTNKIFDLEAFKNNLSQVEKELEDLKNDLNNTDYFNLEERSRLESEINSKVAERKGLQEKLGQTEKEVNENYIFTVERIRKLNDQLKDSFLDIFSDFAAGTKSATEAFNDFATFFLKKISEMILEQLYLNAIGGIAKATGQNQADVGLGSIFSLFNSMPFFHTGGTVGVTQPLMQVPGITKGDESLAVLRKNKDQVKNILDW